MTARLLPPFNIDRAHKPTKKYLEHTFLSTRTKQQPYKNETQFT